MLTWFLQGFRIVPHLQLLPQNNPTSFMDTFSSGRWIYSHRGRDKLYQPLETLCALETNPEMMDSADGY